MNVELGCGIRKLPGFIGVDVSRNSDADVVADIHYLPFKDQSIDFIFANGVFCYLDREKAMAEVRRVLKGGFKFYDVLGDNWLFQVWRFYKRRIKAPLYSWYKGIGSTRTFFGFKVEVVK
jgi:SAM-dependent methyltransferase